METTYQHKLSSLERQLKGQEASHKQELEKVNHEKEEELAAKVGKQKQNYEKIIQQLRFGFLCCS